MRTIGLTRIGNEPVVRYLPDGKPVLELSLAYNYGKKDQTGTKPTQWISATMYGDRVEKLIPYLHKGDQLVVFLEDVHIETYQKKDGTSGSSLKARLNSVELITKPKEEKPAALTISINDLDDDVPFQGEQ